MLKFIEKWKLAEKMISNRLDPKTWSFFSVRVEGIFQREIEEI